MDKFIIKDCPQISPINSLVILPFAENPFKKRREAARIGAVWFDLVSDHDFEPESKLKLVLIIDFEGLKSYKLFFF